MTCKVLNIFLYHVTEVALPNGEHNEEEKGLFPWHKDA